MSLPFKTPVRLERGAGPYSQMLVAADCELICGMTDATPEEADAIVAAINGATPGEGSAFKASLVRVLRATHEATVTKVDERLGYQADSIFTSDDEAVLELFGGDTQVTLPEQEVEVNEQGICRCKDADGTEYELELRIVETRPVGAGDL